jgi:tetratricopeptide (TPR) repeat protein
LITRRLHPAPLYAVALLLAAQSIAPIAPLWAQDNAPVLEQNAAQLQDGTQAPLATPVQATPAAAPQDDSYAQSLRTLAANPKSVEALVQVGQTSLKVGDANAALTYFAKANETAPNDGRVKAGLGSALLLLERPKEAIQLFNQAVALGIAEDKIAADRGLAWDLVGDTNRAQQDYKLAYQNNPSDELLRRYALSVGIQGRTEDADKLMDAQLRRNDPAAWRYRAFIFAMNGKLDDANKIVQAVMPQSADSMKPYLARLPNFTAAQRANAVTFGTMPEDPKPNAPLPASLFSTAAAGGTSSLPIVPLVTRVAPAPSTQIIEPQRPAAFAPAALTRPKPAIDKKKLAAQAKARAQAAAEAEAERAKTLEAKRNPARIWVQVAIGQKRANDVHTWNQYKAAHPSLFAGHGGYVSKLNRTNRVLMGPFRTQEAAKEMIAKLKSSGLSSYMHISNDGEKVDKIGSDEK